MSVKYDFAGRRVLVTGGAGGLGQSIVKKFLEAAATVVVLDKDFNNLSELISQYPQLEAYAVDLTDWKGTGEVIAKVLPIHHLVNNAGIPGPPVPFLQIQPEEVDKVMDVNFKAMINVGQAVAKGMIEANFGGTIVNVSSVMSFMAYKRITLYSTSKAAVTTLTKCMALELAPHNIRVNSVSPTFMDTAMTRPPGDPSVPAKGSSSANQAEEIPVPPRMTNLMRTFVGRQIVHRMLTPEETADLILYLSSSASEMIVGEDILIDGGLRAN